MPVPRPVGANGRVWVKVGTVVTRGVTHHGVNVITVHRKPVVHPGTPATHVVGKTSQVLLSYRRSINSWKYT